MKLRITFLSLALFSACGGTSSSVTTDRLASVESVQGSATTGQSLYATNCASCHGSSAAGGSAPRLTGIDETAAISSMISGPDEMPSYAGLSDQQLADIAAYLVSL